MDEAIGTAILVLGVGMVTVFTILTLVVLSGQGLIRVVNHCWRKSTSIDETKKKREEKDVRKIAAIVATVEAVTGGKGKITKIEKEA